MRLRTVGFRKLSLGLAAALLLSGSAHAAEVKVMISGGLTAAYKALVPEFEKATGNTVVTAYGPSMGTTTNAIPVRLERGEPVDVLILVGYALDDLIKKGKATADSKVELVRSPIGIAVKAGAPKPDISTAEKFKDVMLEAQSYTLYPESASGAFVMKTFEKLGIAEAMKPKLKPQADPAGIVSAVANGEAQYGIFVTHVLSAPGLEPPVAFPAELNSELVFVGAVAAPAPNAAAAQAFVDFLKSPEAVAVFKAKGVTPGA